ncbi:hypothetical protein ES703_36714 [subsurface metagenome]
MWWIFSKKEIIKTFRKVSNENQERDKRISKQSNKFNQFQSQIESNKIKIARLEGAISVLINKSKQSQKSQSQPVSSSLRDNIETKVINRIRRGKKELCMAEMSRLEGSCSVVEMFETIVKEKGLCSKASFYRYLSSLKSQNVLRLRQK